MGRAMQVIGGRVTNPGATITALTPNSNDSFTVRSFPFGPTSAYIDNVWAQEATAGVVRVRSPRLHDPSQGIRERVIITNPRPLLPYQTRQPLYPQDVLTFELSGGGAETDAAAMLVYYEDLPGVAARLATWDQVQPLVKNISGAEVQITTSATAGDWSGGVALNATFDLWKRNVDYAILGYVLDVTVCALAIVGIDTGNLRAGGPGTTEALVTADWFVENAVAMNAPYVPIINAANIGGTLCAAMSTATGATVNVTVIAAELDGPTGTIGV